MTAATRGSSRTERAESIVQVLILLFVAGMAGAASFTHVHDWTMRNAPAGTGSWFGWANAVITELVPAAAGIEVRRRKRDPPPGHLPDGRADHQRGRLPGRPTLRRHPHPRRRPGLRAARAGLSCPDQTRPVPRPPERRANLMCGTCIDTGCPWPEGHCPCPCHDDHGDICPACGWPNIEPDGCACCINPDA